jgi:microsomal dipeptidase-like Zn-dependent dipeptidase
VLGGLVVLLVVGPPAAVAREDGAVRPASLANGCFTIAAATGAGATAAGPFHLEPTGPGTYLLHDAGGRLLGVRGGALIRLGGPQEAGPAAEWSIRRAGARAFTVRATAGGRSLALGRRGDPALATRATPTRLTLAAARGCLRFPEAEVGATGTSPARRTPGGPVVGFADIHLHLTADLRAGGRVIHGRAFHRFGIARALGDDARTHGADGGLDVTGNLLREGLPFGTHDTQGWPAFTGWPVHDTNTHQQAYWVWLQRALKAGLRLVVAQTVEDDQLCRLEPRRSHSCDETRTIELEVRRLRAMEAYVDAQYGGAGRGWFRLVDDPRQARRVIERGKLAVVVGAESSNLFGCGLRRRRSHPPTCTRADVDAGIARAKRLGVRSLFVAHWFDNAFAGAALEGGDKGRLIEAMNRLRTGRPFSTRRCPSPGQGEEIVPITRPEMRVLAPYFPRAAPLLRLPIPRYPSGRRCNARGLTRLGDYLVRRLMETGVLVEADHLSEPARAQLLAIARERGRPVVSSHTGTGGSWTPAELRTMAALGGVVSATSGTAPELIEKLARQRRFRARAPLDGVALGTDTGGFADLPGPRPRGRLGPLRYPFRSYDGRVLFRRQRTGTRTFDLNSDGVAHYGLIADLLADVQRRPGGGEALRTLFGSAEAYLRAWERATP